MGVADLDAVMAIEVQAYSHPWSRGNFTDALSAGNVARVLHAPGDDAAVLGYFVAMPGVGELHLLNITVAPAHHRCGHGLRLLQAVHTQAQALGLGAVWLEVRASNERARAIYRRFGFVEQGVRRGYYPAAGPRREDAVVMNLSLDGEPCDAAD
ncbi:MAG: hypothetical protein RI988_437 [Pseudomonadota bacterium]|jgi:ribosomal-protein-alanine N-acetyltransferase